MISLNTQFWLAILASIFCSFCGDRIEGLIFFLAAVVLHCTMLIIEEIMAIERLR